MQKISYYKENPRRIGIGFMKYFKWLPDRLYLEIMYWLYMGTKLNLNKPKLFQEKLQWLKLFDRRPEYTIMVDKLEVKDYISEKIGAEYVIPTLDAWDSFDEIDFESLPDKFVLKTTHAGGGSGVVICRNKKEFDYADARDRLSRSMQQDIYESLREWPYRDVKKRIFAEHLIELGDSKELYDYKFFCFDGEPKFVKVDFGRFVDHHANYYDMQWQVLPFGEAEFPPVFDLNLEKPASFDKMVEIARKLSGGIPFLRVDLYNTGERIFFGELTFYPASGFGTFTPEQWNEQIGEMLHLPKV